MPVRRPTLQEWFLEYQLRKLWRDHCYLPFTLDADISRLESAYAERGRPTPYTAIVVKALALAGARVPAINRMYLRTVFGPRIVEFPHRSVNLPVVLNRGGERFMGAAVIRDADRLSIDEIRSAIRDARRQRPEDAPVGRYVFGRPNTFLNRLRLRAIHFAIYNFPSLALERKAGGLSVSSLAGEIRDDAPARLMAYGPTAFTVLLNQVDRSEAGRAILRLAIGADHSACRGDELAAGVQALHDALLEMGSAPDIERLPIDRIA